MLHIIIDSTSDFTRDECRALNMTVLPLTIHFGSESYFDGIDLDAGNFYKKLRAADRLPTTSQVPPDRFSKALEAAENEGGDALVITLSAKLSATYSSAVAAAEGFRGRVRVVDSGTGSLGASLLIRRALAMRDENRGVDEIADELERLAPRVRIYAACDTLRYLKMGGRLSGSQALAGTLLGIKPIVRVADGVAEAAGKTRGGRAVFKALADYMLADGPDLSFGVAFAHSDCPDKMEEFISFMTPHIGNAQTRRCALGAVIGTHIGPGVVAVAYLKG